MHAGSHTDWCSCPKNSIVSRWPMVWWYVGRGGAVGVRGLSLISPRARAPRTHSGAAAGAPNTSLSSSTEPQLAGPGENPSWLLLPEAPRCIHHTHTYPHTYITNSGLQFYTNQVCTELVQMCIFSFKKKSQDGTCNPGRDLHSLQWNTNWIGTKTFLMPLKKW